MRDEYEKEGDWVFTFFPPSFPRVFPFFLFSAFPRINSSWEIKSMIPLLGIYNVFYGGSWKWDRIRDGR